jgi:hypothetical protein
MPSSIEGDQNMHMAPSPGARDSVFALCKLEEMKYISVEYDETGHVHKYAPRDSVEPHPTDNGQLRNTDEKHHGILRTTDELIYDSSHRHGSDGVTTRLNQGHQISDSSPPYIKAEPVEEVINYKSSTQYSLSDFISHFAQADYPFTCISSGLVDRCKESNIKCRNLEDYLRHLDKSHRSEFPGGIMGIAGRWICPIDGCDEAFTGTLSDVTMWQLRYHLYSEKHQTGWDIRELEAHKRTVAANFRPLTLDFK